MPAEHYNNVLYPLQDKVFPLFNDTPFYLTGGTALSRGYFNHRYSDDLDYQLIDSDIKWVAPIESIAIKKFLNIISEKIVKGSL